MQSRKTNALYWLTILSGCTMGETLGDFLSHGPMNLGYGWASIALAILVVAALLLERRSKQTNDARYWTTIIIMSTAGTTLADFVTRTLHFGYAWGSVFMVILFAAVFLIWRRSSKRTPSPELSEQTNSLPPTDARYWAAIMVASTAGTTIGDFISNGTRLGFGGGSILLLALLLITLVIESRAKKPNEARYWAALILASTIGATTGDFLTKEEGLNLGYFLGSALVVVVFISVIFIGRWVSSRASSRRQ